jgi:hypothetical protein
MGDNDRKTQSTFTTADEQTLNDLINTAAKLVSPVTVEQLRMRNANLISLLPLLFLG